MKYTVLLENGDYLFIHVLKEQLDNVIADVTDRGERAFIRYRRGRRPGQEGDPISVPKFDPLYKPPYLNAVAVIMPVDEAIARMLRRTEDWFA